jgi:phenylalanyl-tRNA synthetase beta chain
MKLSYNWLSEYVKIDDIDPYQVGLQLTMSTSEIEGVEEVGDELKHVVVGRIVEVNPHPNADHLFLTRVDVGDAVLDIVSGAPNTKKDTHVPVALIGAVLPGGMKVRKAKLRGVESYGVVCSEKELGVSDDHSGLWILDDEGVDDLSPGMPVASLFPTQDYIIEIDNKSLTNRPDLWGHYGFARELAAVYGRRLNPVYPPSVIDEVLHAKGPEYIKVEIEDEDLCPRYSAIVVGGIQIKKSSYMLRRRLFSLGVRPICNIVDITNYVMLEIGQPLHAFDASLIVQKKIIVRRAREGENLTTLDGLQRTLTSETLLITDPEKAVAIAGVMGGLNSEISDVTERIIIEAANFNSVSIRRTAVRIGLRTEASNRFEKSIDPELTALGIVGSVYRIRRELLDAEILSPFIDANHVKKKKIEIPLNVDWVSKLLGVQVSKKRVVNILSALQFGVVEIDEKNLKVTVPSFRATKDISIPQDLVEEVGRIYGFGNIEPSLPKIYNNPPRREDIVHFIRRLRLLLAKELALTEVYTYSFQEDTDLGYFYPHSFPFLYLKNPVSRSMSRLRRSLIPGLFALIGKNITYKDDFSIFEIGSVYIPCDSSNNLPDERQMAAGLVIKRVGESSVFSLMKGKIEMLFERFHLKEAQLVNFNSIGQFTQCIDLANLGELSQYHPGRRALLSNRTTAFGMIAELNPKLLKEAGIDFNDYRVAVFSMDVQLLMENVIKEESRLKYNRLPRYPQVVLALAIVVDESVTVHEVYQFILSHKLPGTCSDPSIIEGVELFDIYRGKPLSQGKKSLAFDVHYRRSDRTLTEKEANRVHEEIAQKIREHGWELR